MIPQGAKQHPKFTNYYITDAGKVWSTISKRFLVQYKGISGHLKVTLYKDNAKYICYVHRLVLETYVGFCPDGQECRHLDGNASNNNLGNLCWGTCLENVLDAIKHGTHNTAKKGELHHNNKLTERDVRMIIYMWRTKLFTQREIAKSYNVCFVTVNDIIHKRRWNHIWSS